MPDNLEELLQYLHSDAARQVFLRSIGRENAESVQISSNPKTDKHATEQPSTRIETPVTDTHRRYVDLEVQRGTLGRLKNSIIKKGSTELAKYAITHIVSDAKGGQQHVLPYVVEIANALGMDEVEKECREILVQVSRMQEHFSEGIAFSIDKKNYDAAIDLALEGNSRNLHLALDIAKQHSTCRVPEIIQNGFDSFDPTNLDSKISTFYARCANILGCEKQANKILLGYSKKIRLGDKIDHYEDFISALIILGNEKSAKKFAQKVVEHAKITQSPSSYQPLVEVLLQLRLTKEARRLVDRVSQHESILGLSVEYDTHRYSERAELEYLLGNTDAAKYLFTKGIKQALRFNTQSPHSILEDIERARFLTNVDLSESELELYELNLRFYMAASLSREIGEPELANAYLEMHHLVRQCRNKGQANKA